MAVSESNVITNVAALTAYSVQTKAQSEASPATGTDSSILYASQSRTQGNFGTFYALAAADVTEDLLRTGKTGSDAWKEKAIAYLVGDYMARKIRIGPPKASHLKDIPLAEIALKPAIASPMKLS